MARALVIRESRGIGREIVGPKKGRDFALRRDLPKGGTVNAMCASWVSPRRKPDRCANAHARRGYSALACIGRRGSERKTLPQSAGKGMVRNMFPLARNIPGSVAGQPLTLTQAKRAGT